MTSFVFHPHSVHGFALHFIFTSLKKELQHGIVLWYQNTIFCCVISIVMDHESDHCQKQ